MAVSQGVDFSFARLTAAQLKAAGFSFAARYLASSNGKRLTAAEVADFQNNDISLVLVWEDEATAALNGFNQGQHDAQEAVAQANALGIPANIPIYLAVDFDINDAQKPTAAEYFKGAASVSPRFRAGYGGYWLIKYLFDHGLIDYGWQTLAWSGGQVDPRVHIYQNGNSAFGGQADIDEARQTNYGQWSAGAEMLNLVSGDIDNLLKDYGISPVQADYDALNLPPKDFVYWLQNRLKHVLVPGDVDNLFEDLFGRKPTQADYDIFANNNPKEAIYYYETQVKGNLDQVNSHLGQPIPVTVKPPSENPNTDPSSNDADPSDVKPLPNLTNNVPPASHTPTVMPPLPGPTFLELISSALKSFWKVLFG